MHSTNEGVRSRARRRHLPTCKRCDTASLCTVQGCSASRVAALASDVYEYAFSQSLGARDMWSAFVAASEGDGALYMIVPGAGIVMHEFTPRPLPSC
jgi:hypothetical protein